MSSERPANEFFGHLMQPRLCMEQGLVDGTAGKIKGIFGESEAEDPLAFPEDAPFFADDDTPPSARGDSASAQPGTGGTPAGSTAADGTPVQFYNYGLALIDGQFWEEAIQELSLAAGLGFEPLRCRELCGDCAVKLGRWREAFHFYQSVYSDESLGEEQKKIILAKIAKCSQEQKKEHAGSLAPANAGAHPRVESAENNPSVVFLDSYLTDSLVGQTATSWTDPTGSPVAGALHSYKVTDLLHLGSSSLVVELQDESDGRKFAGQALTGSLKDALPIERFAIWVKQQMWINSRYLVRIHDLARLGEHFFVVREHLPLSLDDLLSEGSRMPIPLAVKLGYQILEALGDLHLHMAADGKIRNIFHLDLRPSRILLAADKPRLKIYNGGLWKEIEKSSPARTALRELPLPHLSYTAPEQFRVYLARKRPPVFTDIYLFGTLLYEMLTGVPAFKASSFEEYEIQHCEQYPTPPRVWRSDISEDLNDLVMKCLACDPMKRFRSTTQISLALEKSFPIASNRSGDDLYRKYAAKFLS
ncbi:MAG: protein kinase domain-containing protein [Syntrophobacteraceae bacterium]